MSELALWFLVVVIVSVGVLGIFELADRVLGRWKGDKK